MGALYTGTVLQGSPNINDETTGVNLAVIMRYAASLTGKFEHPYQIALEELNQGKIPFIIKRPYGNTFEYWKLEDLL